MNHVSTEQIIERDACSLHYWLTGPENRPLVVFTHGAGLDHRQFDAQVAFIAQDYRVLTWDVRGHGLSQLKGKAFRIRDTVDYLLALLDRIHYEQASFVGHSMGGNIHQELVFDHPEQVQALVMLGCTCNTLKLSRLEALQTQIAIPLLNLYPRELLIQQIVRVTVLQPEYRAYVSQAFHQMAKRDFISLFAETIANVLHYEPEYHITQPLLLTHGDRDVTGNIRKIAPVWAKREPNCHYQIIPNAGHAANLDNPDFFNRLLIDFLHEFVPTTMS
jgi:3-oxoadipate enol-lactonase